MGVLYELQVFQDKAWKIDSVFDDKQLAIEEARRMGAGGRQAMRVIEEKTDSKTGRAVLRPVFRISKANPAGEVLDHPEPRIKDIDRRVQTYVADARRRKRPIGFFTIAFRLLLLAALVGAGFVAVYFVQDYLDKIMP